MQNIKYYSINIAIIILFSYITASTINQVIKNNLVYYPAEKNTRKLLVNTQGKAEDIDINQIMDSGFFPDSLVTSAGESGADAGISPDELTLIGTITGANSVTMAMIMKKGDKQPLIYKLWSNVGGFTITGIYSNYIQLKRNNEKFILKLYEIKPATSVNTGDTTNTETSSGVIKRNVSRAEIQQKVMNDLDKAMEGIKGGPYKVNDKIEGFRIIRIQPTNILYEYGIRNGDIIKRVNGKKIDSTEKLLAMWQGFKSESRLVFDVERNGQILTFDLNITD